VLSHLIWDMGASFGLTQFCSDFIDYVECDIPVWDVAKVSKVIEIETMLHKFTNTDGKSVFLPCISYHLPQTDVRLFSSHTYHKMHGGYSKVYGQSIWMKLCTSTISIDIVQDLTNLLVVNIPAYWKRLNVVLGHSCGWDYVRRASLFWISLWRLTK
jgi:hypothetical protein